MAQSSTITGIPEDEIERLAKDHKDMGAKKIEVIKEPTGTFTLRVTYASDEEEQAYGR
jgi:hypothetical protein